MAKIATTLFVRDSAGGEHDFGTDGEECSYKFVSGGGMDVAVVQVFDGLECSGDLVAIFVNPAAVITGYKGE